MVGLALDSCQAQRLVYRIKWDNMISRAASRQLKNLFKLDLNDKYLSVESCHDSWAFPSNSSQLRLVLQTGSKTKLLIKNSRTSRVAKVASNVLHYHYQDSRALVKGSKSVCLGIFTHRQFCSPAQVTVNCHLPLLFRVMILKVLVLVAACVASSQALNCLSCLVRGSK